jgi:hypothetical protein
VASALAAALLVCSLGLGAWNVALQQQARQERAAAARYEAALAGAARGGYARIVPLGPTGPGGQTGSVALALPVSGSTATAQLIVADLPAAPPQRSYQLWLIEGDTPRSAGTFQGGGETVTVLPVSGDPSGAQAVAVSVEPVGGSPAPTTSPFLLARLS